MENYNHYERKIISNKNRFNLPHKDKNELKKKFNNANILLTGAAGSIGKAFCKDLLKYNFKKIYLFDKNENELTELNRELIASLNKKKIKKIKYICSDLTSININNFLTDYKISHYLNFAAIKHVRSEEELVSTKYMFLTNSIKFIPSQPFYLKTFFSVSSDKTVNPTSLLGISKSIMEKNLFKFKKKNNKIFISTVRFANVSFSNGSILKYVVDRINKKEIFGIPKIIKRFFITHKEASTLCMKSLLNRNNGFILLPNSTILKKELLITDIVAKILKLKKYKTKFMNKISNKKIKIKKIYPVLLTPPNNHGQKYYEEFHEKSEKIFLDKSDKTIQKVKLYSNKDYTKIINNILKFKDINKIKNYLFKNFKSYNLKKNVYKVSQSL